MSALTELSGDAGNKTPLDIFGKRPRARYESVNSRKAPSTASRLFLSIWPPPESRSSVGGPCGPFCTCHSLSWYSYILPTWAQFSN